MSKYGVAMVCVYTILCSPSSRDDNLVLTELMMYMKLQAMFPLEIN